MAESVVLLGVYRSHPCEDSRALLFRIAGEYKQSLKMRLYMYSCANHSYDVCRAWCGAEHTSQLLETRAFGLSELFADGLANAAAHAAGDPVLVACAGCYPTATSLAALPAITQAGI